MERANSLVINDHEEYLTSAGKNGKYQKIISLIVILTVVYVPMIVLTLPMNQRVPDFKYLNGTELIEVNQTTFCEETYYSENFDTIAPKIIIDPSFSNWAGELKIVCKTKKVFSLVGTIYFTASIAGYLALSKFPDRYGRRTVFLYLNLFALISIVQLLFLYNYAQILIASFVLGLSSLNLAIGSIIVNENIDGNTSALVMGLSMAMFPLGGMINAIIMYFVNDWKYFVILVTCILAFNNYLGFRFLKESPKWLIANHKTKEYIETILFIADVNGNFEKTLELVQNKQPKFRRSPIENVMKEDYRKIVYEFTDLFKYKSLRMLTICNIYLWIISGFSFYGILLNLSGLTGNIFIDSFVSYSAEFLAEVGSGIIADKYGRKFTIFWSFVLAALGCGLFPLAFNYYLSIPLLFISCIGVASAFNVLYIYSAELYPTNIKSLAVGVFFVFNRLFAGIVPLLLTFLQNVTVLIFIFSAISIGIMYLLPETLNTDAGDEVPELMDNVYENESVYSNPEDFVSFNELFDESY